MKFRTQIRNQNRNNLNFFFGRNLNLNFKILLNFSSNLKFFLKSFLKPGSLEESLKLHYIPENAIKWPYTNSFDQDSTNQFEQADRDTLFLQTGQHCCAS